MSALELATLYGIVFAAFLVIDLVWLGVVARGLYAREYGALLRPDVRWDAAFVFYAIYIGGVLYLAVLPGLSETALRGALLRGGTLGLVAYAAYDLTNLATLKDYPTRIVWIDMVWGTVLTATISAIGYGAGRWLLG